MERFQSTHSLRSATPAYYIYRDGSPVSIHALLAECDRGQWWQHAFDRSFNPRTPCGVRLSMSYAYQGASRFQSTHSLRSATPEADFALYILCVSIHALLAECDSHAQRGGDLRDGFQSTHSLRSATWCEVWYHRPNRVSIHALLAECDPRNIHKPQPGKCFNPRTPCGVRQMVAGREDWNMVFQSTHSLRSATGNTPEH